MPRTGVSYDDVAESIEILEKAGLKASIRNIRERIGRGSLTTIAEHKREYEVNQDAGPTGALPDVIIKSLLAGAESYWRELTEAAQTEIDSAQAQANARIEESEARIGEIDDTLATVKDENGSLVAAIAERDERIGVIKKELKAVSSGQQAAENTVVSLGAKLETANALLDEKERQLSELRDSIQVIRKERESLDGHLERQANEHARDLASLKGQLEKERATATANARALETQQAESQETLETLAATRQQVSSLKRTIASSEEKLAKAEAVIKAHVQALGESQTQFTRIAAELGASQESTTAILTEKDARIADLSASLKALTAYDLAEKRRSKKAKDSTK